MTSDDRRSARLATASALVVVAAFVASKAARDAILLSRYHVTALPIFTGIAALVSLPLTVLAGKAMTRLGPARLMPAVNVASALLLVGEWMWVRHAPRTATIAIYLHLSISGGVLVSGFWSIVNERFDVQTAKRHIGRIGMGATLGGIAGGLVAERAGAWLHHDEKVLIVIAAMQALASAAMYMFARGAKHAPRSPDADDSALAGLHVVARSRLLRNVAAIVVLGAIAAGALDYVFKADLVRNNSGRELLRSLSLFYTVTSVITAILQVAVCGPLVARIGVPRSVAALPVTATAFGAVAMAVPGAASSVVARGAELVVRNSVYRSGYELLYAPMAEEHKRPTKVVLDVGADKLGDLLGAQLVALIVYQVIDPRVALLTAAVAVAAIGVMVTMRLPASYRETLEASLLARSAEAASTSSEEQPWLTLDRLPTLGHPGEAIPLARRRRSRPIRAVRSPVEGEAMIDAIRSLRSNDAARQKRALGALTPELVPHAIELLASDSLASDALAALRPIAPQCTGALVDVLLDPSRDPIVRRRIPAVLTHGEPTLAAWGLWHALADRSFEVRFRAGSMLARLAADGHLMHVTDEDVFETAKRELGAAPQTWEELEDDPFYTNDPDAPQVACGLQHVFTVLSLVLPAEPLRIALHAVQTDDPALRGTALEYLESILPADLRAQLWPLLEGEGEASGLSQSMKRTRDDLLVELQRMYPRVMARLRPHTDA
ncbi:MAG TPA: hypothetical protein VL463_35275 [Kofleriaceae bacterium]|nr:hypothetical protein [Kofleriaceae bacterium]